MDAAGQRTGQVAGFQMSVLFQNGTQCVHPVQRGGVFLFPAAFPPPTVETKAVVGVVDDPAEAFAPVGQGVVDLVDRLRQRGQAFRHRFQPGSRRRKAGPLLRGSSLCGGHRGQPVLRQKCRRCQPGPGTEQQGKGISGRLHAEHPGYTPARVGGKGLHPPSGRQHRRRCRGTAQPRCRRGKGRVCGAEGCAQHRAAAQGGKPLCPAAQRQLCGGTRQYPGRKPSPPHTAQRRRHGCAHQQRAHARALRGKSAQPKADAHRKQCVRRAVQQKVCPAAAAQRKAQRHAGQCTAARQRGGHKLLRQQPAGCHSSAQRTQLTQAAQRECSQPVEQQPQRRPCRAGGKAILCQSKGQPQPKGHQRPVQHRPAAGKADAPRCQPPRRRAQHRPCRQGRRLQTPPVRR